MLVGLNGGEVGTGVVDEDAETVTVCECSRDGRYVVRVGSVEHPQQQQSCAQQERQHGYPSVGMLGICALSEGIGPNETGGNDGIENSSIPTGCSTATDRNRKLAVDSLNLLLCR